MRSSEFYDLVTRGGKAVTEDLLKMLEEHGIRFCVIGGQAVNHYAEPLVSLDLDLVVATDRLDEVERLLSERFAVRRFPHSLNITPHDSDLRVQIQTDPRYGDFVGRSEKGDVLGMTMPVAAARDVLRGKIWAAQDESRRPSKRRKDLLDIERLIESDPALRDSVPQEVLDRLEL
ncbi:MAG: hypothetical protein WKF44_09775 [Rubrobacteraceae bacterium]